MVTGFNVLKLATYAFIYAVEKFISHQDYNPKLVINDIALIKLKRDIVFSATVKPIALSQTFIEAEADLIAAGWGITSVSTAISFYFYLIYSYCRVMKPMPPRL